MKIKEVMERTGLTDRAIRLYMDNGLISPNYGISYNGRKNIDFSEDDITALKNIATLRKAGFSIDDIKKIMQGGRGAGEAVSRFIHTTEQNISKDTHIRKSLIRLEGREDITCDTVCRCLENEVTEEAVPAQDIRPSRKEFACTVIQNLMAVMFLAMFIFSANSCALVAENLWWVVLSIPSFFIVNILAGFVYKDIPTLKLRFCNHGAHCLVIFSVSVVISVIYHILGIIFLDWSWQTVLFSILICFLCHFILFWNGIISVYCTSKQLGVAKRVIGALVGMIPIAHLFALHDIIVTTLREVRLETDKARLDRERKDMQICKTKYPVLMVHGVFFRDSKLFNYWGRVPEELEKNGATVFYGQHQSALSIADSAKELAERIREIVEETGCGKVNIIAHSKGGLDCRYAIAHCGMGEYIASLTTVNTPHKGCGFADFLLGKIPKAAQDKVAAAYNSAAKKLGDTTPDFLAAVNDLRAEHCKAFDAETPLPEGIYTKSIGSVLNEATNGQFPLNYSYHLVKFFDGPNDGLVSTDSFKWGDEFELLTHKGKRGISHGDMIDLNRENIHGFDVREYYVELVADLRNRGL